MTRLDQEWAALTHLGVLVDGVPHLAYPRASSIHHLHVLRVQRLHLFQRCPERRQDDNVPVSDALEVFRALAAHCMEMGNEVKGESSLHVRIREGHMFCITNVSGGRVAEGVRGEAGFLECKEALNVRPGRLLSGRIRILFKTIESLQRRRKHRTHPCAYTRERNINRNRNPLDEETLHSSQAREARNLAHRRVRRGI